MYLFLNRGIVIQKGTDASGIYDLNKGKFYRVNLDAGEILSNLDGTNHYDSFNEKQREFLLMAKKNGIIDTQGKKVLQSTTKLEDVLFEKRGLRFAWIEITGKCNQNCKHCFMGNDLNANFHYPKEEVFRYIDQMIESGISQLILTGGEPTLHPDIEEILDYLARYDVNITLLTNGTTKNLLNLIPKLRDYGVKTKLSILGIGAVHDNMVGLKGAFVMVQETIQSYMKYEAPLELGMTICSLNIDNVNSVRSYANTLKVPLETSPIYPIGKAKDNYNELFRHTQEEFIKKCQEDNKKSLSVYRSVRLPSRKIKKASRYDYNAVDLRGILTDSFECGQKIIAILSSRKVTPCLLLRNEKFMIGDLLKNDIKSILDYKQIDRSEYNQRMKLSNVVECSKCEAKYVCKAGGCIAITECVTGDIKTKNPYFSKCYYRSVL